MKSVTCTYIFWPSILHKGIYLIIIFTLAKYAVHFISGTVEGNDARQSCGRVTNLNTHRSHYSNGTKFQSEDVHSQVIDILSHSLGPLSSALSAADWLFRNTKEGTPVSVISKYKGWHSSQCYFEIQRKALQLVL